MDTVLKLLRLDLGISHDKRDDFLKPLIESSKVEIEQKGIGLDLSLVEDQMLLSDYAAWRYRKRTEDVPMSNNLRQRIRDRTIKRRAGNV